MQGVKGDQVVGTTVEAGLPNITGGFNKTKWDSANGAFYFVGSGGTNSNAASGGSGSYVGFDASRSNSIYGKSTTVQPPAYLVNIWKRTA